MPQFAYEARDENGGLTAGLIAADSIEKAGTLLSERSLYVVRIARDRASAPHAKAGRGHASRSDVAWQLTQLSVMLETGMRLSDTMDVLARQATKPRVRSLLEGIRATVQEGRPLSEAMQMYPRTFPPSVPALIRASEMSGTLTSVMRQCANYLVNEVQCLRRIRNALIYPAFMLVACLAVTVFLLAVILPRFAAVFASRGATLPGPTRLLMHVSELLTGHWYVWMAGIVAAVAGFLLWSGTAHGRRVRHRLAVRAFPIAPIVNPLYQSRMCRTLAILLNAGVLLLDALRIVRDVIPNEEYQQLLRDVEDEIERGERLSGPLLDSPLIPEHVAQMIDNGDKAGKLGAVFGQLAEFIDDEYHRNIRTIMQFVEPAMILVMGALIGFVSIALLLPLFQASRIVSS